MIEILKAILFGIVEGITEWLPISSTGHMILLNEFVTLDVTPEFWSMFEVVIQLGAIMAVVVLYWNKIFPFYEIYEATSEEIGALRRQLEYRGYNLGIIGTLSDYWVKDKYFKGKLIRLEAVHDSTLGDSHFVECINSELMSGIYWDSVL